MKKLNLYAVSFATLFAIFITHSEFAQANIYGTHNVNAVVCFKTPSTSHQVLKLLMIPNNFASDIDTVDLQETFDANNGAYGKTSKVLIKMPANRSPEQIAYAVGHRFSPWHEAPNQMILDGAKILTARYEFSSNTATFPLLGTPAITSMKVGCVYTVIAKINDLGTHLDHVVIDERLYNHLDDTAKTALYLHTTVAAFIASKFPFHQTVNEKTTEMLVAKMLSRDVTDREMEVAFRAVGLTGYSQDARHNSLDGLREQLQLERNRIDSQSINSIGPDFTREHMSEFPVELIKLLDKHVRGYSWRDLYSCEVRWMRGRKEHVDVLYDNDCETVKSLKSQLDDEIANKTDGALYDFNQKYADVWKKRLKDQLEDYDYYNLDDAAVESIRRYFQGFDFFSAKAVYPARPDAMRYVQYDAMKFPQSLDPI
jgi:hypothetical protein